MVRVKICGITNIEDARAAVSVGADALGFIFHPRSARYITPDAAGRIIEAMPPFVMTVGVFVDEAAERVMEIACIAGLGAVQLHGAETPEFCASIKGVRVIKAARVREVADIYALGAYDVSAFLLDAYSPDCHGGSGLTCDWTLAASAVKYNRPVILAGGLTPENVAEAVRSVRPYAVDVASGVESAPGRKDHEKVRRFIEAAKGLSGAGL